MLMVIIMRRFKSKKKFNNIIIYLLLFLITISFSIRYMYKHNLIKKNTLANILIKDNFGSLNGNLIDVDLILKYALNVGLEQDKEVNQEENNEGNQLEVPIIPSEEEKEPIVYIYNTHQTEKYHNLSLEPFNVAASVLIASKMLKEYLEEEGIIAIVEEGSVSEMLNSLNLSYGGSYKVTKLFLENAKKNNPSLKYFIDLHRDSSKYENTTTEIDGEKYAKILFVVGLDHDNYAANMIVAEKFKEKIKEYNPSLFRGIMQKTGKGVNGIYNQDFDPNTILIEVGGQYNTISEVNNTLQVFAKILKEYIEDDMSV